MRHLMVILVVLGMALPAWARDQRGQLQVCATVASITSGDCGPTASTSAHRGVRVVVMDGDDTNNDCTGGGTTVRVCEYNGSSWVAAEAPLANGESIVNGTDGTFTFTRDEAGTVTLTATDGTDPTALTITSGTTGAVILSPGGAGTVQVGSATTTGVEIATEGLDVDIDVNNANTISLENSTTGSVVLDMRDYADSADDDMAHVALATNCTTATSGAEDCDFQVSAAEAGTADVRMLIDGDGDVVFAPERTDGGNGNGLTTNPQRRINGIPKIAGYSIGVGKANTGTLNTDLSDETPEGEWIATANMTSANGTDDTPDTIRMGTGSLKVTVGATPAAGNGVDNTLGSGDQNWTGNESFGMWMRCDTAHSAGDWVLEITDSVAGATTVNIPAQATTDTWDWLEVDISGVADASKDVIQSLAIDLSAAGATTFAAGGVCYFDYLWKWDADAENALGVDVYEDGILSVFSVITAGAAITPILEVEGTDWFAHYETGNDFIVSITDLSADSLWGMAALE